MGYMLETRGLTKRFGRGDQAQDAVADVSLHIREGEVYGLLGPNGAGKSTTLKMICGMLRPTAGEILFAGHAWRREDLYAIGSLIEEAPLYPSSTPHARCVGLARALGDLVVHLDPAARLLAPAPGAPAPAPEAPPHPLFRGRLRRVGLAGVHGTVDGGEAHDAAPAALEAGPAVYLLGRPAVVDDAPAHLGREGRVGDASCGACRPCGGRRSATGRRWPRSARSGRSWRSPCSPWTCSCLSQRR